MQNPVKKISSMKSIFVDDEAVEGSTSDDGEWNDLASDIELHRSIDRNIALMTGELSEEEDEDEYEDDSAEDLAGFIVSDTEAIEEEDADDDLSRLDEAECMEAPRIPKKNKHVAEHRVIVPAANHFCLACERRKLQKSRRRTVLAVCVQVEPFFAEPSTESGSSKPIQRVPRNLPPDIIEGLRNLHLKKMATDKEREDEKKLEADKKRLIIRSSGKKSVKKAEVRVKAVAKTGFRSQVAHKGQYNARDKLSNKAKAIRADKVTGSPVKVNDLVHSNDTLEHSELGKSAERLNDTPKVNAKITDQGELKSKKCMSGSKASDKKSDKKSDKGSSKDLLDYCELMKIAARESLTVILSDGFGGELEIIPTEHYKSLEEEGDSNRFSVFYVRGSRKKKGMDDFLVVSTCGSKGLEAPMRFASSVLPVKAQEVSTRVTLVPVREVDKALKLANRGGLFDQGVPAQTSPNRAASTTTTAPPASQGQVLPDHTNGKKRRMEKGGKGDIKVLRMDEPIDPKKVIAIATKKLRREHTQALRFRRRLRLFKTISRAQNAALMEVARDAGYNYTHGPPLTVPSDSVAPLPNPTFPNKALLAELLRDNSPALAQQC
eukprot:Blabericola_migrator_1__5956@NODE_2_length_32877_cov_165_790003_g1_i0_p7_GENE_NODE_2_length_32877_cov_165_790003_g1_i0NODE_2_length_32877_cov_165_790003_g1_i0_p7_ORF_typecomplete_len605_score114_19SPT6_acidic/PF14632_6/0_021SPT6_acidic/PF14632_6/1_3e03SPT6_acidic/PF14632_6/1_8e03_NODE_2_length_32877_cov_165_790003_g1_i012643078